MAKTTIADAEVLQTLNFLRNSDGAEGETNGDEFTRVFADGFKIQSGNITKTSSLTTKTFPVAFDHIPIVLICQVSNKNQLDWVSDRVAHEVTKTNFKYKTNNDLIRYAYIAFGY